MLKYIKLEPVWNKIESLPITQKYAIADLLVKAEGTPPEIVEVKTGDDPQYTTAQSAFYPLVQYGYHMFTHDLRVTSMDLTPEEPLPPLVVIVYYKKDAQSDPIVDTLPPPDFK